MTEARRGGATTGIEGPDDVLRAGLDPRLDELLGGGVEGGSSVLLLRRAGTGKSLLTLTFLLAALARGERLALFVFDEEMGLLFDRARGPALDLDALVGAGRLFVEQVDAAELTAGEFSERVRRIVEVRSIGIDSLNGYQAALLQDEPDAVASVPATVDEGA